METTSPQIHRKKIKCLWLGFINTFKTKLNADKLVADNIRKKSNVCGYVVDSDHVLSISYRLLLRKFLVW